MAQLIMFWQPKCFITKDSQGEGNQLGNRRQLPWKCTLLLCVGMDMCGGSMLGSGPCSALQKACHPIFHPNLDLPVPRVLLDVIICFLPPKAMCSALSFGNNMEKVYFHCLRALLF